MNTSDLTIQTTTPTIEPENTMVQTRCVTITSITSGFETYFKGKFVTITGIDKFYVQDIHYWLHNHGSLYEYKENCSVVVIVGQYASEKRLRSLKNKYPNATFIEYNREFSKFVSCPYESAIAAWNNKKYTTPESKEEQPKEDSLFVKIIAGIIAVVVVGALLYLGLGLFLLLMIFIPGAAKAFLKGFIK